MPAPTLNATPGDSAANTYATLAEAEVYVASHTASPTWNAAADDLKNAALLEACFLLDNSFRWTGGAALSTQALTWPRLSMTNRNGFTIDPGTIPVELKRAQCEFARQLIEAGDKTDDNDAVKQNITAVRAGSVSVSFASMNNSGSVSLRNSDVLRAGPDFDFLWKAVPDAVRNHIPPSWYIRALPSQPLFFGAY